MMVPEAAEFTRALNVSRETLQRLDRYAGLLRRWNRKINLVSQNTIDDLWTRHFLDSAQIFELRPTTARHWADLGSGGGFPGLVVAVLAAAEAPELRVTLVESDLRKAAFLTNAARELGLSVRVEAERIEALAPLEADILSARALAPLHVLLQYADRHLIDGGRGIFLKGARADSEIEEARKSWNFDLKTHPSKTAGDSTILEIGALAHA